MNLLPLNWYFTPPIDYEYKEYTLLAYLMSVDDSFKNKKLSPHFLHIEKLLCEINNFKTSYNALMHQFEMRRYKYFDNPHLTGIDNENLDIIVDLIDLAEPQLNMRLVYAQNIFKKHNQLLY